MTVPETMQAAILVNLREPLAVDTVSLPPILECGQVLVEIHFSGICGSQIGEIDGVKGDDPYLPHLLGHEGSGKVLAVGPGVRTVSPGDHVVMHWRKGSGIDAVPPKYKWQGRDLNAGFITTFNEYAIVSENRVTAIPKSFDLAIAPLFGCAVTTGFGVVSNNARLKIGESIVVIGAGGVGLNIIQAAAMTSAHPIVAVDLFDNRLKMAETFGATHMINAGTQKTERELFQILGKQGADVTVDNTGNPEMIALAYKTAHAQGRTILVGVPRKHDNISIYSLPLHFGKILTGSHGGETDPSIDIPRLVRLFEVGKLRLDGLITDQFPLTDINKAIAMMREGTASGRCLLHMKS